MQEELNQFERHKVRTLVPMPHGKTIIGTKWIWKNKMDEHGVVVKNKASLVAHGYNQQEGIDYDKILHQLQDLKPLGYFLPMQPTWMMCRCMMCTRSVVVSRAMTAYLEAAYHSQDLGGTSS
ncbi:retrovirus-related pol polyprotein from transposon TNT 1-94 [Tanacetum coccineum]|uniref:Retrovirus-related pol polyprotein from transposon TNT 1-94 n=1 Tax=Tanacetum coccineum TaxID=301880 RepID=A0ABQ5ADL3_9ASTR